MFVTSIADCGAGFSLSGLQPARVEMLDQAYSGGSGLKARKQAESLAHNTVIPVAR